jgi:DNA-binding protein H-NS
LTLKKIAEAAESPKACANWVFRQNPQREKDTMAKSYQQLQAQIDSLQKKADAARKKELEGVISEIKSVIEKWGVTAEDLGLSPESGTRSRATKKAVPKRGAKSVSAKTANVGAVKYQDRAGNVWSGRGPRPAWLRAAIEAGQALEEFLV